MFSSACDAVRERRPDGWSDVAGMGGRADVTCPEKEAPSRPDQENPNRSKENKEKSKENQGKSAWFSLVFLGFPWISSSQSRLLKGLRAPPRKKQGSAQPRRRMGCARVPARRIVRARSLGGGRARG